MIFKGALYGIAEALPVFLSQSSGHFVTIVSTAGIQISPTMAVYAAAKNAVRTLNEGLRLESEGRYRVTSISPGFVRTDFAFQTLPRARCARVRRYQPSHFHLRK